MELENPTMRIFSWKNLISNADSAQSTALQRAYKGHQSYNLYPEL